MAVRNKYSYCKVCFNKDFNQLTGIYCKLTGQKPSFVDTCHNFKTDIKGLEKLEEEFLSGLNSEDSDVKYIPTKNFINYRLKEVLAVCDTKALKIYYPKLSQFEAYIWISMELILLLIIAFQSDIDLQQKFIIGVLIISSIPITIGLNMSINYKDPKLIFDNEGISGSGVNKKVKWENIVRTLIKKENTSYTNRMYRYFLLIYTLEKKEPIQINISGLKFNYKKIGAICEYLKRNRA